VNALLLALRLALAAVFLVAAVTKLADRTGTRRAIEGFGVPFGFAAPGAVLLPIAELAVCGCLLVPGAVRVGAIGALALLGAFSAAIAVNLARGRQPDCHCFGQLHSEPVGGRTLVRNGVFAAGAILILALGRSDPGPSAVAWIGDLEGAEVLALVLGVVAVVAVAAGSWFAAHLLRQHGRLLLRIERLEATLAVAGLDVGAHDHAHAPAARGLPVGEPAPSFEVPSVAGGTTALGALLDAGRPALMVFTDAGCGPCQALLPDVSGWQAEHGEEITIAVLSSGDRDLATAKAAEEGLDRVLLDPGRTLADAYEVSGTPAAVLLAPDGTIAAPLAEGADAIRHLLAMGLSWRPAEEEGPAIGDEVPAVTLSDLDGDPVAIADRLASRGSTLVVFWNAGCGFCREMHADLVAYDGEAGEGAPRLLVVSAGEEDEVRAEGFTSFLLDPDFTAASAFGASGTPMGLLVDAEGRVASRLAAGAGAVLDLARPLPV
jgi:peroxiredoxin/uncharacterized membrane protein YphA (DoxX/SURF4 family)